MGFYSMMAFLTVKMLVLNGFLTLVGKNDNKNAL